MTTRFQNTKKGSAQFILIGKVGQKRESHSERNPWLLCEGERKEKRKCLSPRKKDSHLMRKSACCRVKET